LHPGREAPPFGAFGCAGNQELIGTDILTLLSCLLRGHAVAELCEEGWSYCISRKVRSSRQWLRLCEERIRATTLSK
jgi:hypothetical protein